MFMKNLQYVSRCAAYIAAFGAMASLPLCAQQSGVNQAVSPSLLALAKAAPTIDSASGDSSSADQNALSMPDKLAFAGDGTGQPPPRRRYGRPTYHDGNTNADGSRKYTFDVGGGMTIPTGNAHKYLDPNYVFEAGAGRNFSNTLGVLVQFEWDNFGFQGANLTNQGTTEGTTQAGIPLDGKSHVWSFTLDPIINYVHSDSGSAYVIVGGGFYHKTANFTVPETGESCDFYGFCYEYAANATIDKYTSNAGGVQGGLGFTKKLSRFGDEKIFLEAKYVFVDNQPKAASNTNLYPANSHRTEYIPVTFGLRW